MKILIVSPIDESAIERLRTCHEVACSFNPSPQELPSLIRDREALVFRSGVQIGAQALAAAPQLRLLVRAGCGLDNLDMDYVRKAGIHLARIRRPAARAVSELAFALMLNLARKVRQADSSMRKGEWSKDDLRGSLLFQKRLGIVGAGNIGSRLGALGAAWGMKPIGCVEHPGRQAESRLRSRGVDLADLEEVLSRSDFVAVTVPLKESTRNLIDEKALSRIKPSAYLINVSRGGVVDEQALFRSLSQGRLAGAALDVHRREGAGQRSPLAELDNVLLTPHIGSMTLDTQKAIGDRVVELVEAFAARAAA